MIKEWFEELPAIIRSPIETLIIAGALWLFRCTLWKEWRNYQDMTDEKHTFIGYLKWLDKGKRKD